LPLEKIGRQGGPCEELVLLKNRQVKNLVANGDANTVLIVPLPGKDAEREVLDWEM
jgi:hypothetical protein